MFRLSELKNVLKNISLTIGNNDQIAIVGKMVLEKARYLKSCVGCIILKEEKF